MDIFRIAAAPPFPGLRRFPEGRRFKQWTGDDSKALMKARICLHSLNRVLTHNRSSYLPLWVMFRTRWYRLSARFWSFVISFDGLSLTRMTLPSLSRHCKTSTEIELCLTVCDLTAILCRASMLWFTIPSSYVSLEHPMVSVRRSRNQSTSRLLRNPGDARVIFKHLAKCCLRINGLTNWLPLEWISKHVECWRVYFPCQ
jgi:hypothetical protein